MSFTVRAHWLNFDSPPTIEYVLFSWHVFPYKKLLKLFSAGHGIFQKSGFPYKRMLFNWTVSQLSSVQLKVYIKVYIIQRSSRPEHLIKKRGKVLTAGWKSFNSLIVAYIEVSVVVHSVVCMHFRSFLHRLLVKRRWMLSIPEQPSIVGGFQMMLTYSRIGLTKAQ